MKLPMQNDLPLGMLGRTATYRFYNSTGALLYVGISSTPDERANQHRRYSPWWPDVDMSRTLVYWRETRGLAEAEEVAAVIVERPIWNVQFKPGREYAKRVIPTRVGGFEAIQMTAVRRSLGAVVERAAEGEPIVVLHNGRPRAAFVSVEVYNEILELRAKVDAHAEDEAI